MTSHSPQAEAAAAEYTERRPYARGHFAAGFDAGMAVKREADREAVRNAVAVVLTNAINYPKPLQAWILGLDMGPLIHRVAEQVSGVIREAPATAARPLPSQREVARALSAAWSRDLGQPDSESNDGYHLAQAAAILSLFTTDTARVCYMKPGQAKGYCGRKPKVAYADWAKVTCSDCLAAGRADQP